MLSLRGTTILSDDFKTTLDLGSDPLVFKICLMSTPNSIKGLISTFNV